MKLRNTFHNFEDELSMFNPMYIRIFFGRKTIKSIQYNGFMDSIMRDLYTPIAFLNMSSAVFAIVRSVVGKLWYTDALKLAKCPNPTD